MTDTKTRVLNETELVETQRRSMLNRDRATGRCGCFHCLSTFPGGRITEWVDDGATALCPVCGIDSVLTAPDDRIDEDALVQMHDRWFGRSDAIRSLAGWDQAVASGALPRASG